MNRGTADSALYLRSACEWRCVCASMCKDVKRECMKRSTDESNKKSPAAAATTVFVRSFSISIHNSLYFTLSRSIIGRFSSFCARKIYFLFASVGTCLVNILYIVEFREKYVIRAEKKADAEEEEEYKYGIVRGISLSPCRSVYAP